MLSDRHCRNAKPGLHADGDGLYLRVLASGKKTWMRRDRAAGKDSWRAFGSYPELSLADARKPQTEVVAKHLIGDTVDFYISKLKVKHPLQIKALLKPLDEARPVMSYTSEELTALLDAKAKTAPVMANRMTTRWKHFFKFCVAKHIIQRSPMEETTREFIGGAESPGRTRVLSWDELVSLLRYLPQMNPGTAVGLYAILATGLRSSEALWVLKNRSLTLIPTKEHYAPPVHNVPAVPHMRAILKRDYPVAPSKDSLAGPLLKLFSGPGIPGVSKFTPHDLRRTFATRLGDLGVLPHVVEKMLDHQMTGMMARYNYAEFWPERTAAMKLWGRKLSELRRAARATLQTEDSRCTAA